MQALKALVVGMGILILLGVVIIGVTIFRRTAGDAPPPPAATATAPAIAPGAVPTAFGARDLAVPAGSQVVSVTGAGALVVVHARDAEGRDRLLALDPATGRQLGEWRLAPPSSAPPSSAPPSSAP